MVGTLSICFGLLASPVSITLCRRNSTRLVAVIGGLVLTLGCLFTSFAQQFHQVFLSYGKLNEMKWMKLKLSVWIISIIYLLYEGLIVGLGVGITRDCSIVMIGQYFKKKREFVEIFAVSGSGLGIIIMSMFVRNAIGSYGWR